MKISVVGLGKLGLCTAACFAAAGHDVFGYDRDGSVGAALEAGHCPIQEPGLQDLLQQARPRLHVVDEYRECVSRADATMVIVPTPSHSDGRFDCGAVSEVLEGLAPALRDARGFHVVSIVSTVMPGTCREVFEPLLEKRSGKRCGIDFGLAYNPEFIALGSVIRDFLNPDLVLIGASDKRTAVFLQDLYRSTVQSRPHVATMSLINAEICKLSLNCFVTMKISFANALAAVCERVAGANVDTVTSALGSDRRIGTKCLRGGLGFGGPCFPRDNRAFQAFAAAAGSAAPLSESVIRINDEVPRRLFRLIRERLAPPARIALLGMSYKTGTHIVEESHALRLTQDLIHAGFRVGISDPLAANEAIRSLDGQADVFSDPYACIHGADAVVLLTDWPEYRELDWARVSSLARPGAVVVDSWRIAADAAAAPLTYIALGIGPSAGN